MKKELLNPVTMLFAGLLLGLASRLFDMYFEILGNIFSQLAIWILLGTLISIYSKTRKKAMLNVFLFSVGMLITYYAAAVITDGVYSKTFIIGWTVFALCSPIMAFIAWLTKGSGVFPKIISTGIVAVSVLSSVILFDRLRIYDAIIDGALIYFLFFYKIKREKQSKDAR